MTMRISILTSALSLLLAAGVSAQEQTLTVYTYDSFAGKYGPGGAVKERFQAVCSCTLEWIATEDAGTLLARLKLEGPGTRSCTRRLSQRPWPTRDWGFSCS